MIIPSFSGRYLLLIPLLFSLSAFGQKKEKIELLHANSLQFDKSSGIEAQKLIGEVRLKHKGAIMDCDSAYLFSDENRLWAYSNVHINQGDTIDLYSDSLKYQGNKRLAKTWGNIRMVDNKMTLTTDTLEYDMKKKLAHYKGGGKIVNEKDDNTLTSQRGYYNSGTEMLFFRKDVVLEHPDYTLYSDTLNYEPTTGIATITGPTTIDMGEDDELYCENGWYDTHKDKSRFYENAFLRSGGQLLEGDSLLYDQSTGIGWAYGHVKVTDTTNETIITGQKGYHNEPQGRSFVTGKALLKQAFEEGDSLFLHADTLITLKDTADLRTLKAYYGARFYREDMQGKCDSLVYSEQDSLFKLFHDPVLWSGENQMSGEKIEIKSYEGKIEKMWFRETGFIISRSDSGHFNQIKGRTITGKFKDNDLRKIFVEGNGETIYYAREEGEEKKTKPDTLKGDTLVTDSLPPTPKDSMIAAKDTAKSKGTTIGVNEAKSSNIMIRVKENEIQELTFLDNPTATLHPIHKVDPKSMLLDGFFWALEQRPLGKHEVFKKPLKEKQEKVIKK